MERRALALSGLGAILVCVSVTLGSLSSGYGMGGIPILLRVGVGFVVLGMVTARWSPLTIQRGVLNAVVSAIAIFVVGISVMYYDLGLRPSEHATPLTLGPLVSTQILLLMITLPVPAGNLTGVLTSKGRFPEAVVVFLGTSLGGALGGTMVSLAEGSAPGFTGLFFFLSTFVVMVFALFPVVVMDECGSNGPPDT